MLNFSGSSLKIHYIRRENQSDANTLQVNCLAKSCPEPKISWYYYKDDSVPESQMLTHVETRIVIQEESIAGSCKTKSTLTAQIFNSGFYVCQATNGADYQYESIMVDAAQGNTKQTHLSNI